MKIKTLLTTYSTIVLLLSLLQFAFGGYATYKADDYSYITEASVTFHNIENPQNLIEADRVHWKKHWILFSTFLVFVGLFGSISGVGMLKYKKWAWQLWLSLISIVFLIDIVFYFGEIYAYQFQKISYIDFAINGSLFLFSWLLYTRNSTKNLIG